jgi:sarcosine oxidase subunit beta
MDMEPHVSNRVQGALHCPLDGVADHTVTTRSLAHAASKLGVQIREHCRVVGLEKRHGRVDALITETEERIQLPGALLFLCNGHIIQLLRDQFGIQLPVWTDLPQVILTEEVDPMPARHLMGHAHRLLAIKPNLDGRVMISGGWRGRWNYQLQRGETVPEQIAGNLAEARAVYPCLEGATVTEAMADRPETISYDQIPIIDRVPGTINAFFATGWSGHGWAIAPAVNRLLANWVLENKRPPLLRPFSYSRFHVAA